jgi:hypothetical protein
VAPAFRAVPRHRCSTGFNSGLEHCGAYLQRVRGFWRAHSHGPEPEVHAPPCWSRRIVAQYICGHRAQHIMRTYHAVSHGRNWTRSEQSDAAHTEGILIDASRPATPPRGGSQTAPRNARGLQTCVRSADRAGGHSRCGREHPARLRQGTACPCTASEAAEVLTRGSKRRPRRACHRQPDGSPVRRRSHTCGRSMRSRTSCLVRIWSG